jgi:exodeoxyribonuclease V beta subunit
VSIRYVARPSALRGIPIDRHAVIEASAGTGKTFTLEHVVVELLLRADVTFDRILVVTFTEKATNELRQRLRAKLLTLASEHDAATSAPDSGDDCWAIDETARRKLQQALRSFDAATIATIHAFCQRVLRENAFASARMLQEQQVDGRDAFARAMREALRRDIARDHRRASWLEAALRAGWSMQRIEELLWDCLQSRGDLRPLLDESLLGGALDAFPVEDARRTSGISEMRSWGVHATTARTVASRLYELANLIEKTRLPRDIPGYTTEAQEILFPYLLDKLPTLAPRPGLTAQVCTAALELARRTPTFPAGLAEALLPAVCGEMTRHKLESGQYDFDDMLRLVDQALQGEASALSKHMRRRWRYVLIDEFQDTDEIQWSIFRRAFFEGPQHSVIYLVGDPKQSIYRFRGADVDTYLSACQEVVDSGGRRVQLDHNYRATQPLVEATNAIFDQSSETAIFTGDVSYTPVRSGGGQRLLVDGDGHALSPVHMMRLSAGGDARWLSILGQRIAREVRAITDPSRPWRLDGRPLAYGDVFVLTRSAREGRTIGAALGAAGVPHAFYKQDGLFQTDEAKEIRTLLLAIERPGDRARRLAAWLTPFFGLQLAAIDRARDVSSAHPLMVRLEEWRSMADEHDFERLFESILRDSGIVRREIFFADKERELTNYLHILELLLEHAHRSHGTLRDLVNALSGLIEGTRLPLDIEGNVQRLPSGRSAVQIMTIHKSKGLEAPIVFVAGGFQGMRGDSIHVFHEAGHRLAWVGPWSDPGVEKLAKAEEREEEQRIMYVALTRAKGRLYLPCIVASQGDLARGEPRTLRGPYGSVNRRIWELVQSGHPLFSVEDVGAAQASGVWSAVDRAAPWRPPAELLRDDDHRATAPDLRESRLGTAITSYTRMKGERPATRPMQSDRMSESTHIVPETELRAARTSGIFLHELLERVPLNSFGPGTTFDDWRSQAEVSSLFDEAMVAHRIDRTQREHAERLVWRAYNTPLQLSPAQRLEAIGAAGRIVREMGFVFSTHERSAEATPARSAVRLVRGSVDLAFEEDGVVYFVDWKSDTLASYSREAIARHMTDHYEAQAQLYAVAIAKLLGSSNAQEHTARFGGMFYCFLRGLDASGNGVWSARPDWEQVLAWEGALRNP